MRRPSSNSTTVFVIAYGTPSRIDMPNFAPSDSRAGCAPRVSFTVPDPSIKGCWEGSASTSKTFSCGAAITRSTETDFTFPAIGAEATVTGMNPVEALEEVATLLERKLAAPYKVQAFRRAADTIRDVPVDELHDLARQGRLQDLPRVGSSTASVVAQAPTDDVPEYLARLRAEDAPDAGPGAPIRAALRGDLHLHSDWSDGGSPIETMARHAAELGHEYMALTDHSPSLSVAQGLTAERLREQLDVVARLNEELAPFRILTGIEVDILEDGTLDQDEDLLAELDVVVASVHSKLRMPAQPMTDRMVAALASPHTDILGHCTGRMVMGRGRPESQFDSQLVFGAAAHFDKAVEINCRPERLDPPMRLLKEVVAAGCKVSIDSDAHAPGQLEWQPYGCSRAAEAEVPMERIVNTWEREPVLDWTASHQAA
jgi:putative hydrolase